MDLFFPIQIGDYYLKKAIDIGFKPEDVIEKFIKSSGKGGQNVNKTSSCVWLKHFSTGIEVKCQKYREQSKNRISAWRLLILKLEERIKGEESEIAQKIFKIRKQKQRRSRKAKEKMLELKKRKGLLKESRRTVHF